MEHVAVGEAGQDSSRRPVGGPQIETSAKLMKQGLVINLYESFENEINSIRREEELEGQKAEQRRKAQRRKDLQARSSRTGTYSGSYLNVDSEYEDELNHQTEKSPGRDDRMENTLRSTLAKSSSRSPRITKVLPNSSPSMPPRGPTQNDNSSPTELNHKEKRLL